MKKKKLPISLHNSVELIYSPAFVYAQ